MSVSKEISSEELQGSWVELSFSGSSSHTTGSQDDQGEQSPSSGLEADVENMLLEAQHESARNSSKGSSHCNSPLRSQTPLILCKGSEANSSQSEEDFQERRREVENLMVRNADWIWDWSSRPENNPPKEFLLKHPPPRRSASSLSIRNTRVMKSGGVLSPHFLKLFLPSLVVSHILAIGLGIYIGKRLTSHNTY
ncbi:BCL2 interacting protein 4 [Gadus macrocephalus]|uniref:BCL2 interacting protein 4 n=1 Tax=Gadus chalcogrammus TaxID=1042646 RepID=UPI0024C497CB|nr:BCL2 interacting protein 4 [Gadus chalcogrammus]XP_059929111.1 BCL2 interacting protein 4 [Gadus macrocephalus]